MKKVGIIIPMYNVAPFLKTCLDSVYNQGIDEDKFQVVLIDDGSPDNSLAIAKDLTKDRHNVTIITQENKGLGGARNTGIDHCEADYLLFLDSDDRYVANSLNALLSLIEQHLPDILEFGAQAVMADGSVLATHQFSTSGKMLSGIEYKNTIHGIPSACNKLYKRSFIERHALRFRERIFTEDFEFNTRAFFFAEKVMATPHMVGQFLQNPNSITRTATLAQKRKYISDFKEIIRCLKAFSDNYAANATQQSYIDEKFGLANFNIFYILAVNGFTFSEMAAERKQRKSEGLYFDKIRLYDKKKDLFRRLVRYHFYLFRILKFLKRP